MGGSGSAGVVRTPGPAGAGPENDDREFVVEYKTVIGDYRVVVETRGDERRLTWWKL
jgi:hypothetical protein